MTSFRIAAYLAGVTAAVAIALSAEGSQADAPKVAVFDFELIDTSLQGEMTGTPPADLARIAMISNQLREQLAASGRYAPIDLAPVTKEIEDAGYLHSCNGCAVAIARQVGAELAFTGTVQKVSNLILNINVYLHEVASGKPLGGASVDIRGNTDKSWSKGLSYLVRNRILK